MGSVSTFMNSGTECFAEECGQPIDQQADNPVMFHNEVDGQDIVFHRDCLPPSLVAALDQYEAGADHG